ncbi:hypothetical protein ACFZA9_13525 [Streptomyces olivaceus]|uniref:hypothetical protein n=1 Tax=Streptomyces olivaceus TaxID=47716 RepID=UPI0036E8DA68
MRSQDEYLSRDSGRPPGRRTGTGPSARTDGPQALLQTLQNEAGNDAVARTIASSGADARQLAGSALPLQRITASPPAVQRVAMANTPTGSSDSFGESLTDDDVRLLNEAAARVHEIIEKAQEEGKKVLLFIGVGTGNPSGAWGNSTAEKSGPAITDEDQHSPGFLDDAEKNGYQVIAVNFNVGDGNQISESGGSGSAARLTVPAKFPISADGKEKAADAVASFHSAAQRADRFALMNAVTQVDYQPLLDLATAKKGGASSYMKSYMADGSTSAFSAMNKKKGLQKQGGKFNSMGDVFGQDMSVE